VSPVDSDEAVAQLAEIGRRRRQVEEEVDRCEDRPWLLVTCAFVLWGMLAASDLPVPVWGELAVNAAGLLVFVLLIVGYLRTARVQARRRWGWRTMVLLVVWVAGQVAVFTSADLVLTRFDVPLDGTIAGGAQALTYLLLGFPLMKAIRADLRRVPR